MDYLCKSFHLMIICIRNRRRIWTIHPCWYICHCRTFHSVHIRPYRRKTVRRPSWKILLRKRTRKSRERFHSDRSNKYADFQRIRPNLFNDNNKLISMSISNFYMFYIPTQECPDGERAYPSWHWHLNEPSMLMQIPWAHIPVSPHSSWSENKTKQTQIQQNKKHPPHSVAYPQCVCWGFIKTTTTLAADFRGILRISL